MKVIRNYLTVHLVRIVQKVPRLFWTSLAGEKWAILTSHVQNISFLCVCVCFASGCPDACPCVNGELVPLVVPHSKECIEWSRYECQPCFLLYHRISKLPPLSERACFNDVGSNRNRCRHKKNTYAYIVNFPFNLKL